jgi:hypothetical protein
MRLDEWHAVLATEPATPYQRGAIMGEFERLGYGRADRAERLAVCAALLDLDDLGSTAHLVMGQAGQLYRLLLGIAGRAELLAAAGLDGEDQAPGVAELADDGAQADEQPAGVTLAAVIRDLIVQIYATITPTRKAAP